MEESILDGRYRMDGESNLAWDAYQQYRDMLKEHGKRSLQKLAKLRGNSTTNSEEKWSVQFRWQERVTAYDEWLAQQVLNKRIASIAEREVDIYAYQDKVMEQESATVARLFRLLQNQAQELLELQGGGAHVDTMDIKRLSSAMKDVSTVARRSANLPTSFTQEQTDEPELENTTFVVGADD